MSLSNSTGNKETKDPTHSEIIPTASDEACSKQGNVYWPSRLDPLPEPLPEPLPDPDLLPFPLPLLESGTGTSS